MIGLSFRRDAKHPSKKVTIAGPENEDMKI
jgi:hypothetical protein